MGINQAKGESLKLSSRKLIAEITIAYINAQAEQETIKELKPLIAAVRESEKGVKEQVVLVIAIYQNYCNHRHNCSTSVNSK